MSQEGFLPSCPVSETGLGEKSHRVYSSRSAARNEPTASGAAGLFRTPQPMANDTKSAHRTNLNHVPYKEPAGSL